MRVGELLDQARALYLEQFAGTASSLSRDGTVRVLSEPVLRNAEGHPALEGELSLPMRADLVALNAGDSYETVAVDSACRLEFEELSFEWDGALRVTMRPFSWDAMTLRFAGAYEPGPLVEWFKRWFREEEDGEDATPLDVVHFMSDPIVRDGSTSLTIDLGSAPVDAFEELLDAVCAAGVRGVVIDQS